jgi:hypothetical protein
MIPALRRLSAGSLPALQRLCAQHVDALGRAADGAFGIIERKAFSLPKLVREPSEESRQKTAVIEPLEREREALSLPKLVREPLESR